MRFSQVYMDPPLLPCVKTGRLPWGSSGWEPACQRREGGFQPCSGDMRPLPITSPVSTSLLHPYPRQLGSLMWGSEARGESGLNRGPHPHNRGDPPLRRCTSISAWLLGSHHTMSWDRARLPSVEGCSLTASCQLEAQHIQGCCPHNAPALPSSPCSVPHPPTQDKHPLLGVSTRD